MGSQNNTSFTSNKVNDLRLYLLQPQFSSHAYLLTKAETNTSLFDQFFISIFEILSKHKLR